MRQNGVSERWWTVETCWQICGLSWFAGLFLIGTRCDLGVLSCHVLRLPQVLSRLWRGGGQGLCPVDLVEDAEVPGKGDVRVEHLGQPASVAGFQGRGPDGEIVGMIVDVGIRRDRPTCGGGPAQRSIN